MNGHGLRVEIQRKLEMLASGEVEPGPVADWAAEIMATDREELRDRRVWNALDQLAGADLMTSPGVFLHSPADFAAWLQEYDESAG